MSALEELSYNIIHTVNWCCEEPYIFTWSNMLAYTFSFQHVLCDSLEVSLEKQQGGVEWPSLREEGEGMSGEGTAGVPLRGPVADQLSAAKLEELQKKIAEVTKTEVSHNTTIIIMAPNL